MARDEARQRVGKGTAAFVGESHCSASGQRVAGGAPTIRPFRDRLCPVASARGRADEEIAAQLRTADSPPRLSESSPPSLSVPYPGFVSALPPGYTLPATDRTKLSLGGV